MEINISTDKTIIIPENAPMLIRVERLEAECCWQTIRQEEKQFLAEGMAELKLAYLALMPDNFEDCDYERLLQLLDEAACEPQLTQHEHYISLQCPLTLCGQLEAEGKIIGLQLCDIAHSIISPRALEIRLSFCAELQQETAAEASIADEAAIISPEKAVGQAEKSTEAIEQESCLNQEEQAVLQIKEPLPQKEGCEDEKPAEAKKCIAAHLSPRLRRQSSRPEAKEKGGWCMKFYRVREGESLWSIAEKMQVSAADISRINNLTDGEINTGMLLSIPL